MKVIEIRKAGDGKPNVWIEAGNLISLHKIVSPFSFILEVLSIFSKMNTS